MEPVPVATWSNAWALMDWTLRSWVRIPLLYGCLSLSFYVVLPCVGSGHASGPIQGVLAIVEMIKNLRKVILNWNRSQSLIRTVEGAGGV
jgi:hypothetical protein